MEGAIELQCCSLQFAVIYLIMLRKRIFSYISSVARGLGQGAVNLA